MPDDKKKKETRRVPGAPQEWRHGTSAAARGLRQDMPEAFFPIIALPGGGTMPLRTAEGMRLAREMGLRPVSIPDLTGEMMPAAGPQPTAALPEEAAPTGPTIPEGVTFAGPPGLDLTGLVQGAQAAGSPVEVTSPEGEFLPLAQAPAGEYGQGGYAQFGLPGKETTEGGPLTLMRRGEPRQPAPRPSPQEIAANAGKWIQRLEIKMMNQGMHPNQRMAYRQFLANLLVEGGFDPGVAAAYTMEGLTPQVAQGMSGQFQQKQQAESYMERLERKAELEGAPTPKTSTRGGTIAYVKAAKQAAIDRGKYIAVIHWPHGETTVEVINRAGLRGKAGTLRAHGPKGAEDLITSSDKIEVIDARPKQMPLSSPAGLTGGAPQGTPTQKRQRSRREDEASSIFKDVVGGM